MNEKCGINGSFFVFSFLLCSFVTAFIAFMDKIYEKKQKRFVL